MSSRPCALFFGTPAFAVPFLEALHRFADVRLVISQPDKRVGRGMSYQPTAVKTCAEELGLEFIQPARIRQPEFYAQLRATRPDFALVVAYGRILNAELLTLPTHGCVNAHASLLPRWRGAAPIQHAIWAGDKTTGVSLMHMEEGLDTGPVFASQELAIAADDSAGSLAPRLASLGAGLLHTALPAWLAGERPAVAQDDALATIAPKLSKQDGLIHWHRPAAVVHNHIRAMNPWPGAYTHLNDQWVKIHEAMPAERELSLLPGELCIEQGRIYVGCAEGCLDIKTL